MNSAKSDRTCDEQVSPCANEDSLEDVLDNETSSDAPNDDQPATAILPTGLAMRVTKQYIAAAAACIVSTVLIVVYRTPQCLFGYLIAAVLVYMAMTLKYDYRDGNITELCLLCSSVTSLATRNASRVVFRTQDEVPQFFEFIVAGRSQPNIIVNQAYLIYFSPQEPKTLLAYTIL